MHQELYVALTHKPISDSVHVDNKGTFAIKFSETDFISFIKNLLGYWDAGVFYQYYWSTVFSLSRNLSW